MEPFILANLSFFGGRELMSFKQAKEMQDNGWEIGSHTLNHLSLTRLDEKELERQLNASRQILENNGFIISSIAFPYGDYDEDVITKTKKYYLTSRPMQYDYNNLNEINFYELKSKWVMLINSPEEVCSWIVYTRDRDLWLILNFHYVGEDVSNGWSFSTENFEKVLDCINDTQIQVKTIKEVWDLNEK